MQYDQLDAPISQYWSANWSDADRRAIEADQEDPKDQACWEAFALLLALNTWKELVEDPRASLALRGDAQGVLQDVIAGRAKSPRLNRIIAEMQLVLAPRARDLWAIHWWSERNIMCDNLSRGLGHDQLHDAERVAVSRECNWQMLK